MGSRRQQIGLVMTHAYIMTFIKFVPESSSLEKGAVILIKVRGEGFCNIGCLPPGSSVAFMLA